jgi:hypothetical protein
MDTGVTFLDCPAYLDEQGAARCGLPASVEYRYTAESTDGPAESAKIRCPRGHCLNSSIESLTWRKHPAESPKEKACGSIRGGAPSSTAGSG